MIVKAVANPQAISPKSATTANHATSQQRQANDARVNGRYHRRRDRKRIPTGGLFSGVLVSLGA
jgi:hypothetical protein